MPIGRIGVEQTTSELLQLLGILGVVPFPVLQGFAECTRPVIDDAECSTAGTDDVLVADDAVIGKRRPV